MTTDPTVDEQYWQHIVTTRTDLSTAIADIITAQMMAVVNLDELEGPLADVEIEGSTGDLIRHYLTEVYRAARAADAILDQHRQSEFADRVTTAIDAHHEAGELSGPATRALLDATRPR